MAAVERAARQLRIQVCRNRRQIVPFSEQFLSRESAISSVHLSQILAVGDRAIRSHGLHVGPYHSDMGQFFHASELQLDFPPSPHLIPVKERNKFSLSFAKPSISSDSNPTALSRSIPY